MFTALANKLAERHQTSPYYRRLPPGVLRKIAFLVTPNLRLLREFLICDTVIVHTAACLSLPYLLLARVLGKRSVAFAWDDYTQKNRFAAIERAALVLCDHVVVPSSDFYRIPALQVGSKVSVCPLWPTRSTAMAVPRASAGNNVTTVVFAGQINAVRGLPLTLRMLSGVKGMKFQVHVFSNDRLPEPAENFDTLEVVEHGSLSPEDLDERIAGFDLGLVSLDPQYTSPAFPSKILTYFSAALPVLYHGPNLAAVTGLLKDQGLGVVLREQSDKPLCEEIAKVRRTFSKARADYLRSCQLSWDRLAVIL